MLARSKVGDDKSLKVSVVMKPQIQAQGSATTRSCTGDLQGGLPGRAPQPEISWSLPGREPGQLPSCRRATAAGGPSVTWSSTAGRSTSTRWAGRRATTRALRKTRSAGRDARARQGGGEPAAIRNKACSVIHVPYGDVVSVASARLRPAPQGNLAVSRPPAHPRLVRQIPGLRTARSSSKRPSAPTAATTMPGQEQRRGARRPSGSMSRAATHHQRCPRPSPVGRWPRAGPLKLIDCRAEGVPAPRCSGPSRGGGVVLPAPTAETASPSIAAEPWTSRACG